MVGFLPPVFWRQEKPTHATFVHMLCPLPHHPEKGSCSVTREGELVNCSPRCLPARVCVVCVVCVPGWVCVSIVIRGQRGKVANQKKRMGSFLKHWVLFSSLLCFGRRLVEVDALGGRGLHCSPALQLPPRRNASGNCKGWFPQGKALFYQYFFIISLVIEQKNSLRYVKLIRVCEELAILSNFVKEFTCPHCP